MKQIPSNPSGAHGLMREEALQALRDAVGKVIQEHKRLGMPLTVWRDGQVVKSAPTRREPSTSRPRHGPRPRSHEAEWRYPIPDLSATPCRGGFGSPTGLALSSGARSAAGGSQW